MAAFEVSTFIDRPVEEVFYYMSDPTKFPEWQSGSKEAYALSDGPIGVGSTFESVGQLLGRDVTATIEISQWDPPYVWGMKASTGPLLFEGIMTYEAQDGGTLVIQNFEGEIGGLFSIAEGMAIKQLQKQVETDGQNLKRLLEGG